MALGFEHHDHEACISDAVAEAEAKCLTAGLQFTPVRRRALEILLQGHRAMGAYDVLERLRADGFGAQPPVAYRALEFLVTNGFAHRIERLNAFVACARPGESHAPAFLICRNCEAVAETGAESPTMDRRAKEAGFRIERSVIELEGLCPECQGADA